MGHTSTTALGARPPQIDI